MATWHPFTQMQGFTPIGTVVGAQGAWVHLADGRRLFDGVSSWWLNVHGHGHPVLVDAIASQAARFSQVVLADLDHAPAATLSEALAAALPGDLRHVFFSDDGSTAMEAGLKMAWQAQRAWHGEGVRDRLVAFDGAYHGDTLGAMSVGARDVFTAPFHGLLRDVIALPYDDPEAVERALAAEGDRVAAVVIEPLVQGAGGMVFQRPETLARIAAATRACGALLVVDEVMTGFGRLGTLFAIEQAGIVPDVVALSKGLTGGTLPLGATVTTPRLYDTFLSERMDAAFLHGHSYTGNPLACAAAVASLGLFAAEDTLGNVASWAPVYAEAVARWSGDPRLANPRFLGGILAVDVAGGPGGYLDPVGRRVKAAALARGLHLRPLGDAVFLMPPLATPVREVAWAVAQLAEALDEVLGG